MFKTNAGHNRRNARGKRLGKAGGHDYAATAGIDPTGSS